MMFSDRPPAPLAEYLGFLLNWVGARSRRSFMESLEPLGLNPRVYGLLVIAGKHPGATQQELAAAAQIDPSSMVALIDELEAAGLAERRAHSVDRRKRAIHLTAAGEAKLEAAQAVAKSAMGELTAPLTAAERKEFRRLLRKVSGLDSPAGDGSAR